MLEIINKLKYLPAPPKKASKKEIAITNCRNEDRLWKDTGFDMDEFERNLKWFHDNNDYKVKNAYEALKKYRGEE